MSLNGINYDVGTRFGGELSRVPWRRADVQRELRVIREQLRCTTVNLFGSDITRLAEAGEIARAAGLGVWLQPRLIDGDHGAVLDHLAEAAGAAERLRRARGDVVPTLAAS